MRVLVTGATGYIGSRLVGAFVSQGYFVVCIVRSKLKASHFGWYSKVKFIIYDGTEASLEGGAAYFGNDTVIIHLATVVDCQSINSLVSCNVTFGIHLLEIARKYGASKIIDAGTYWQFSVSGKPLPNSLYATTKSLFQLTAAYYAKRYNIRCLSLILYDTYGETDPRKKLLNLLIAHTASKKVLKLTAGEQKLDMVHVDDVINAFILACSYQTNKQSDEPEYFFVSTKRTLSLKQIVYIYESIMDASINILWGAIPYRDNQIMQPYLPLESSETLPGWVPKISFENGIFRLKQCLEGGVASKC
ncbi:MAG: NAD(P)-dependent oxidoreductase [Coxiellaceae bacterium]|nr:NAD(P)-dependent oxidoreductase [Coxiellaceae bacterium]